MRVKAKAVIINYNESHYLVFALSGGDIWLVLLSFHVIGIIGIKVHSSRRASDAHKQVKLSVTHNHKANVAKTYRRTTVTYRPLL